MEYVPSVWDHLLIYYNLTLNCDLMSESLNPFHIHRQKMKLPVVLNPLSMPAISLEKEVQDHSEKPLSIQGL